MYILVSVISQLMTCASGISPMTGSVALAIA
jgi:hypothetical protein